MTINNIYDVPVFIINMPNREDRMKNMIKLMKDIGFKKYTFVEPFKADENTKMLFQKLTKKETKLSLSKISHNMTYINLLSNTYVDSMFIFEDDVIPTKTIDNVKKDLEYVYTNHPKDSHMIYFEMCFEKCNFKKDNNFTKIESPLCAASIYYPNKNFRKELYDKVINFPTLYMNAIDGVFSHLIRYDNINSYILDMLFIQDSKYGSDLEGSIGYNKKNKPFLPICKNYEKTLNYIDTSKEFKKEIRDMYVNDDNTNNIIYRERYPGKKNKSFEKKMYILFVLFIIVILLINYFI
jgi:hypothetical protein